MLEKISDRVYYMMNQDDTDRPVLGVVLGTNSCLIVDAGNSPKHANEFILELEEMKIPPIKYLVLTHYHFDHVFGISEWEAITIANKKTNSYMNRYRQIKYDDNSLNLALEKGIFNEYGVKYIKSEIHNREKFSLGNIDICYSNSLKIDLGELTCEIRTVVSPHTDDSTIIYIPEEKVLFLGDSIYGCMKNGKNYFDKDKLFSIINTIEQYEADYYVCSHESVCTKQEIISYFQQLRIAYEIAYESTNLSNAALIYKKRFNEELAGDMLFYVKSFKYDEG